MSYPARFLVYVSTLSVLSLFYSCSSISCGSDKDAFLDNYYDLVQEVRKQQKNGPISDSQWKGYDSKFENYTHNCYTAFENDLSNSDKIGIAACTGYYLYAKHGMMLISQLAKQEAIIKEILSAIDPLLMMKVAKEILENPEEIKNIIRDLEKRYG